MKHQVTRISVLQSSKIMTALYVLMGFFYTFIGILMLIFGGREMKIAGLLYCFMPIILAIVGFLFFILFAAAYNWLASRLGGIEFELTPKEEPIQLSETTRGK